LEVRLGYEQAPVIPELDSSWFVNGFGKFGTATVRQVVHNSVGWRVEVRFPKGEGLFLLREFDLSEWRKIAKCLDDE
jgi:hypothetical protein